MCTFGFWLPGGSTKKRVYVVYFLPRLLPPILPVVESVPFISTDTSIILPPLDRLCHRRIASTRASAASASSSSSLPPPLFPRLRTLNLHGNRLSPYGASQLLSALVKQGAMPALRYRMKRKGGREREERGRGREGGSEGGREGSRKGCFLTGFLFIS